MKVTIHQNVLNEIHLHGDSSMRAEICGILIGTMEGGHTDILARIEGKGATEQGANVTFTQETWEYVYKVKDEHYDDLDIVGWYHTHPGFGIFLSSYDIFIHENFFGNPGQVAWVYDPHSKDEGCFHWKDKDVVKCSTVETQHDPVGGKRERPARKTTKEATQESKPTNTKTGKGRMNLAALILLPLLTLALGSTIGFVAGKGGEKETPTGTAQTTPPIDPPQHTIQNTLITQHTQPPPVIEWKEEWLHKGDASLIYKPTAEGLHPAKTIIAREDQLLAVSEITKLNIPIHQEYRSQEIKPNPPLHDAGLPIGKLRFWAESNPNDSTVRLRLLKVETIVKIDERYLATTGRYEPEADGHYRIPLSRNPAYTAPTATSPTDGASPDPIIEIPTPPAPTPTPPPPEGTTTPNAPPGPPHSPPEHSEPQPDSNLEKSNPLPKE